MQEADYSMTQMAHEGNAGRQNGDENLLVKFYMHPKENKARSLEEGRPIFEERAYLQIMQPGNKDSIVGRMATDMDKARFPQHWQKFQARMAGEEEQIEGTLLSEWTGVSRSQVEELLFFNIRTVEQLAGVSDSNSQNFRGINALKARAVSFLEAAATNATAEMLIASKKENAELREMIAELSARVGAVEEETELSPQQKAANTRKKNAANKAA